MRCFTEGQSYQNQLEILSTGPDLHPNGPDVQGQLWFRSLAIYSMKLTDRHDYRDVQGSAMSSVAWVFTIVLAALLFEAVSADGVETPHTARRGRSTLNSAVRTARRYCVLRTLKSSSMQATRAMPTCTKCYKQKLTPIYLLWGR